MKKLIMAAGVALLMVGCGESAPKCDDSGVKDLVLDASRIELKKEITSSIIYTTSESMKSMVPEREMAKYEEEIEQRYGFKKSLAAIDNENLELLTIRTESTDDKTQRSTCKAQLKFSNGETRDISYTAQMTSEGKLFVEVSDLEKK